MKKTTETQRHKGHGEIAGIRGERSIREKTGWNGSFLGSISLLESAREAGRDAFGVPRRSGKDFLRGAVVFSLSDLSIAATRGKRTMEVARPECPVDASDERRSFGGIGELVYCATGNSQ